MNDFDNSTVAHYMSEDDIVADLLLYQMTEDVKRKLMQYEAGDLAELHRDLGQPIRNYYRLSEPNNPYVDNVPGSQNFPDEISMRIIERLWTRLTGKAIVRVPAEIIDNGDGTYIFNGALVYSIAVGASGC